MRARYAAVASLLAASTLAGCGGLATSAPIQPGLDVGSVQENEVRVEANPVAPGSSPSQVVAGFIRAAAASDDQYQVARSYLAPKATWRPDSSVVVFRDDSVLNVRQSGEGTVEAIARATATVDGSGRYQEVGGSPAQKATFGLERAGGEWRISRVPDGFGTWLSESDFNRLYDPFRIYFVSAVERRLVPDVRWFPLGTGVATRLARALLAGVPDYLRGAVRTDIPAGARLAVDAVTIDSGLATVDLKAARLSSDPGSRQNLGAQFFATVGQAPGVDRVALQLEGAELEVPGADRSLDSLAALGFGTPDVAVVKPLLRLGTRLVPVAPERVGDLGDPGERTPTEPSSDLPELATGWAYPALSADGREVAAVSGDRAELARWRGAKQVQVVTLGSQLTRPTYDTQGMVWVGGQDAGGGAARLWVVNAAADPADPTRAKPQPVAAPWLAGRTVVSVRLAPEGQRVAVMTTSRAGTDPRLDVAGVVRQANGVPTALSGRLTLAPSLSLMRDAVWVDDATLAVLGRKTTSQVIRPWFVPLGGEITAGPGVVGAQSISTINAERGLVVTTDGQQVLVRAGNLWRRVGEGTDLLVAGR
ncbi:LpqB family beta-propeller domain-containing protein [Pedococcus sp. 5OH_020]|uniref:LpqB family beta-propeller domain-containing protein n=1 Tax=Pedococcus sp. 5OH_020 TaxID=2989814 RepID=UPI0022E9D4DA|nr:LpqB family beta-propeller domain-containing protein [Pedococcus sp. 5OH_020]